LQRTVRGIILAPANKAPDLHGEIEITVHGSDRYARLVRVEAGQTRATSCKVMDGQEGHLVISTFEPLVSG